MGATMEGDPGSMLNEHYPYDVALSYASEDRAYAETLAKILRRNGVKVFYDKYEKSDAIPNLV